MSEYSEAIFFGVGHAVKLDKRILALSTSLESGGALVPQAALTDLLTQLPELMQGTMDLLAQELINQVSACSNSFDMYQMTKKKNLAEKAVKHQQRLLENQQKTALTLEFLKKHPEILVFLRHTELKEKLEVVTPLSQSPFFSIADVDLLGQHLNELVQTVS